MKRFLAVLIGVIALNSCDDGDLVVETINFADVPAQRCGDDGLLFKLNDQESLILNIPKTTFTNIPTAAGDTIRLDVSPINQVVYSFYTGKVAAGNICDLIPSANPAINNQWIATSGKIQITITDIKKLDETNNSTRITEYNNNILFKNITFDKGNGTEQFYETFTFGDYIVPAVALPFDFNQLLSICNDTKQVYQFSESESFTLDIDPLLIANVATPAGQPRVGQVGATVNKLVYRFLKGLVTNEYFCTATVPLVPTVIQEWVGRPGGTIEVTTTPFGTAFKHTIVLKNVALEKGNSNFNLGTTYLYGELQTTN